MTRQNVTFAYPNFKWADWATNTAWSVHPYNIGLLAAMIEDRNNVGIIDANFNDLSREDFSRKLINYKTNILGISVGTNEYLDSGLIAARVAKETDPKIKTVIGGVSAISSPSPYINDPNVDYIIYGEGENVFNELCMFFEGNSKLPDKGILYKENGEIINKGKSDLIKDLDSLPFPAYHLVDFSKYSNQIQRESVDRPRAMPFAHFITSRGCPFNCCFCEVGNISGKKPRYKSLEYISKEIEWLKATYGIKGLVFDDDNLVYDKSRAKNIFKMMIDKKYDLKWNAPAMALYKLDESMIELMKESGCSFMNIAIESGSDRVLSDIIHKPLRLSTARTNINLIKKYDIELAANFVIGFPGETWEDIQKTISFAEEINIDYIKLFIATPFPNTKLYEQAVSGGYLRKDFNPHKHLWADGWIDTEEFRHQDLKILRAYEWDRINFSKPEKRKKIAKMMDISEERLNEIRKETLRRANP